jgi:hypothetical protein
VLAFRQEKGKGMLASFSRLWYVYVCPPVWWAWICAVRLCRLHNMLARVGFGFSAPLSSRDLGAGALCLRLPRTSSEALARRSARVSNRLPHVHRVIYAVQQPLGNNWHKLVEAVQGGRSRRSRR